MLEITIKSLQQQTHQVKIDPAISVRDLKVHVAQECGQDKYPPEEQKLIYNGVIMQDSDPVSKYKIDTKKFVVVMRQKPKEGSSQEVAPSATVSSATKPQPAVKTTPSKTATATTTATDSSPVSSPLVQAESCALLTRDTDEYANAVRNIMELNYTREQVEHALQVSFNNPNRAVEYLMNGLPAAATANQSLSTDTDLSSNSDEDLDPLIALRTSPQFAEMQAMIHQNPEMLADVLAMLRQSNPGLLRAIAENQDLFMEMLNEPMLNEEQVQAPDGQTTPPAGHGNADEDGLNLTAQDNAAIRRIVELGFPEYLVVQAYFACDKNENLAAELLLTHANDEEPE